MRRGLPPIRKASPDGFLCRGCGALVPKGRQSWCSNECRDRHYMALSSYARRKVYERDHGDCADMSYVVVLRENATGIERQIKVNREWDDGEEFYWSSGNFGCDCNRELETPDDAR